MSRMVYALSTGAGKDATLALHRARAGGLDVRYAFNLYDGETERVAFHGTRRALVEAHARALDLEPMLEPVGSEGFEPAFLHVLDELVRLGVGGVVMGNIHLADVRAWYEDRTSGAGLKHVEPIWGEPPGELAREVVALGYRATVVSVDLAQGDADWVGRELDLGLVDAVERHGADACGERGEYHTFVSDGPAFRAPVPFRAGELVTMKGHRFVDLVPE
jgi:uncharacterized protein (TIGR00290 family)